MTIRRIMIGGGRMKDVPQNIPTENGAYIAFHLSDGRRSAVRAEEWPALEAMGYTANGVLIVDDGMPQPLVMAPTSVAGVNDYGQKTNVVDAVKAASIFDGKERTQEVAEPYTAENFDQYLTRKTTNVFMQLSLGCYIYKNGTVPTECWWMPSSGELHYIMKHNDEIQECLSKIKGAKLLGGTYHSNTEYTTNNNQVWVWQTSNGTAWLKAMAKSSSSGSITRPVTSFEDLT